MALNDTIISAFFQHTEGYGVIKKVSFENQNEKS